VLQVCSRSFIRLLRCDKSWVTGFRSGSPSTDYRRPRDVRYKTHRDRIGEPLKRRDGPGRDMSASIISSHRDDNGCHSSLSPIRNIFVNHDVGAMEAKSGPIYDLLPHDLHAAAASGSAEFWICVSRIQSSEALASANRLTFGLKVAAPVNDEPMWRWGHHVIPNAHPALPLDARFRTYRSPLRVTLWAKKRHRPRERTEIALHGNRPAPGPSPTKSPSIPPGLWYRRLRTLRPRFRASSGSGSSNRRAGCCR
jgi:hypothetical protein